MECIQLSLFGRTYPEPSPATTERTSAQFWKNLPALDKQTLLFLDLRGGGRWSKAGAIAGNGFKTKEQEDNAFEVAIDRRDFMRIGMEQAYNRFVLPAPISDVMRVPYRAEIVWLIIRHALAWHDNPEGMPGCVSYYDPMNRSDQPRPKIELREKGANEE